MDQKMIKLVQSSWLTVDGIAPEAAALFYQNLFNAEPNLKHLFKGDMRAQGHKLIQMIGAAVSKLNDFDTLVPILQNLAKRHVGYGVVDAHYATVGSALLLTLEQGLTTAFTPEVKAAWAEIYGVISDAMIAASHTKNSNA